MHLSYIIGCIKHGELQDNLYSLSRKNYTKICTALKQNLEGYIPKYEQYLSLASGIGRFDFTKCSSVYRPFVFFFKSAYIAFIVRKK